MAYNLKIYLIAILLLIAPSTLAAKKVAQTHKPVQSSLVVDMQSGKILHAHNAKTKINPASLTKVMTLYIMFEYLDSHKLSMSQKFRVSENAAAMLPSKLGLKVGEYISVHDAILALIVRSANDVAKAVAENISGSETKFVKLMNGKAKQLGMHDTNFTNASGWHHNAQKTTAVDLAKLTIAIKRDYPQFYHLFSKTSFNFHGQIITGHNNITANYPWSDGLKTGYTRHAGFNLITTATKGNKAIAGIITGRSSASVRDKQMVALLDKYLHNKTMIKKNKKNGTQHSTKLTKAITNG